MHKLGPASSSPQSRNEPHETFLPGECVVTDLQGPDVRSRTGAYYSQIFIDLVSRRVWTVGLTDKTGSDEAIRKVLIDAKARSGRNIKILRTDGDGIFGRSASFQKIKEEFRLFTRDRHHTITTNLLLLIVSVGRCWKVLLLFCFNRGLCGKKPGLILFL